MRIAILGRGNVATHLVKAFTPVAQVLQIDSHRPECTPADVDFIILAVSDRAVRDVAARLPDTEAVVVHTSGSVPARDIAAPGRSSGVLYPLQTFTKGRELDYAEIPFFTEGDSDATLAKIDGLAALISRTVRHAGSAERRRLHLAAVFACNFANHLYGIADSILSEGYMSLDLLLPLMRETLAKLGTLSPAEAQTGPAARGDLKVMEKHLEMLEGKPQVQELYRSLSESIMRHDR